MTAPGTSDPTPRTSLTLPILLVLLVLVVLVALPLGSCTDATDETTTTDVDTTDTTETTEPTEPTTDTTEPTTTTSPDEDGVERPPTQAEELSPDSGRFSTCSQCHSLLDRPSGLAPALTGDFSHARHLDRDAECTTCHYPPIHSEEGTRTPTMPICYSCHGLSEDTPSAECSLCHPADFDLTPPSHTQEFYGPGHSRVVEDEGTDECFTLCHEGNRETFCRACHGLEIPHPQGWVLPEPGDPGAHVEAAHDEGEVCVKCHRNRIDPPASCYGGECHGS